MGVIVSSLTVIISEERNMDSIRLAVLLFTMRHEIYGIVVYSHHLFNLPSEGTGREYIYNESFDTAWGYIFENSIRLNLTGAIFYRVIFFNSYVPSDESYLSSTNTQDYKNIEIPSGAKLFLITLKKSENPDGYDNIKCFQEGNGISFISIVNNII